MTKLKFNFIHNFSGWDKNDDDEFEAHLKFKYKKPKRTPFFKITAPKTTSTSGARTGTIHQTYHKESHQMCIFKFSHKYGKELNKKHFDYIQREGKGRGGEKPELYGADPQNYEKRIAKLHYRWIISPENQNVDLTSLVHDFIDYVEFKTGFKLNWVAANHYNTGHQHAHILINGFDLKRRKLIFNKDDLIEDFRAKLKELCTCQVGTRSLLEQQQAAARQTTSNTFTNLDRRLENLIINQTMNIPFESIANKKDPNSFLHRRIMHLKNLNLAKYNPTTNQFTLHKHWKEKLKIYTRYNTYLDGFARVKCPPQNYHLHSVKNLGTVKGKVIYKYFMQDNSNTHAIILETEPQKFVFVPLLSAPTARIGTHVKIEFQHLSMPDGSSRQATVISEIKQNP